MDRSENMRRIRDKDMAPELAVRKLTHSMGYRYRLHGKDLPGKPDLVFASPRKVIFVHGCFWHVHDCKLSHWPKSNLDYWTLKLTKNKARDAAHVKALRANGWRVLIVWECELKQLAKVRQRIARFLC